MNTDRIEKEIVMKASRARVWRALTDAREFGAWFGVRFEGAFTPGATVKGAITGFPKYEGLPMTIVVERIEPETLFAYRWHPNAHDPNIDYSAEPMTLVEMRLDEVPGGTRLSIVESGFDGIPIARRAEALRNNTGGWATQAERIAKYVA
jgi:uncharacterized protein YndB with AHSA1/START domain